MADSTFTIFYSWQSDLPNSTTRGLIESSIEAAVRSLRNTVSVYADRDTQGVTGSPDIVQTIFSKIDECDVFVADVTSVATYHPLDKDGNETDRLKATPNANVMIELGYATQVVGWDNIICIMNDDYNHDGEIPFDIEHHRLTHFSLIGKEKAEVRKQLAETLKLTTLSGDVDLPIPSFPDARPEMVHHIFLMLGLKVAAERLKNLYPNLTPSQLSERDKFLLEKRMHEDVFRDRYIPSPPKPSVWDTVPRM